LWSHCDVPSLTSVLPLWQSSSAQLSSDQPSTVTFAQADIMTDTMFEIGPVDLVSIFHSFIRMISICKSNMCHLCMSNRSFPTRLTSTRHCTTVCSQACVSSRTSAL
jgi:hypothetical protein